MLVLVFVTRPIALTNDCVSLEAERLLNANQRKTLQWYNRGNYNVANISPLV